MSEYKIKFYDSKKKEVNEGDYIKIICQRDLIFYTKFTIYQGMPVIERFSFNTFEVIDKYPDNLIECYGDMEGIYYLLNDEAEIEDERKFVMDYVYFRDMNKFYKIES